MAYSTVTLTGTYELPNGTADTGKVHITPSVDTILDADGNLDRWPTHPDHRRVPRSERLLT